MSSTVSTQPAGRYRIRIITPALAAANNGNWRSAERWARFLGERHHVSVTGTWPAPDDCGQTPDLLIALHARRSAASVAAFADTGRPLVLVLTGTDLYRDIQHDAQARRALALAHRLVLLQPHGLNALPAAVHAKTVVIEQSAPRWPAPDAPAGDDDTFRLALVGHLRPEKDPLTAARAVLRLNDSGLRLWQVGRIDQSATGLAFAALAEADPRIRCLGNLPHDQTRALIARSHLLVLPSQMEGGANVLIEALMSGVPALCSAISGSFGVLGETYPGYFPVGDDAALAALIARFRREPGYRQSLRDHAAAQAWRFEPARECRRVNALVDGLLGRPPAPASTA